MARGRDVILEVLRTEGVRHVFGNPGSTELPLIDALVDAPDLEYVLALQEASVVAMADGYAQATGRPSFVNLHTSAGLGNAIGNLTNAQANGTPIVVTAGQQDYRHIVADPLLSGDLVGLARATTKWAHEVRTLGELGTVLRRAFHDAASVPRGPVFVSLPMHLIDEEGEAPVPAASKIDRSAVAGSLAELAALLSEVAPDEVVIVAGDAVAHHGAADALVSVAEALGARVFANPLTGMVVFPSSHPLFAGPLPAASAAMASTLGRFRRVFVVGNQAFKAYPYSPGPALPEDVELLHLSADPHELGRTWPTRLGLAGDPRTTLEALLPLLQGSVPAERAAAALTAAGAEKDAATHKAVAAAEARYDDVPMHPSAVGHALFSVLPDDVPVVDESITTGGHTRPYLRADRPGKWFFAQGGGLGWGMPAAVGVSLGRERSPVLCVVGDGSAMYSPQALWTAAHLELPTVFAVVNNRQYLILKNYLRRMDGSSVRAGRMIGMDLDRPPIDFVALAQSMGVEGTMVEKAHDVAPALEAALASGRPHLLELPISAG